MGSEGLEHEGFPPLRAGPFRGLQTVCGGDHGRPSVASGPRKSNALAEQSAQCTGTVRGVQGVRAPVLRNYCAPAGSTQELPQNKPLPIYKLQNPRLPLRNGAALM